MSIKIESLDVLKSKEQLDLQDKTRGNDVRKELDEIVDRLNSVPVSMSLIWTWAWDLIRFKYEEYKEVAEYNDYVVKRNITLDDIWDTLWANPSETFTLEYGALEMDEAVTEWLVDNSFLIPIDDVLDEDENDVLESEGEEV
jgi:hypothetical protein